MGWGRTVYSVSELLPYSDVAGERRFVPLVGISGDDDPYLQINTIIDRLSSKFHARGLFVNTQGRAGEGCPPHRHREGEGPKTSGSSGNEVEMAVVGLGDPPNHASRFLEELPTSSREELCSSEAVGDILGQFFLRDGGVVDIGQDYEQLSFELSRLPGLDRVLCLAGGPNKVAGIETAARAGYITDLVTDEATARALCERL